MLPDTGTPTCIGELAANVIHEQLERLLVQEPEVRADSDPEAVHKMRVATRRLRTALRLFEPWLSDGPAEPPEALRRLAASLGRVRDMDVFAAGLRAQARGEELPAVERLLADSAGAYAEARASLLAELDGDTLGEVRRLREVAPAGRAKLRRAGPKLVAARLRALRRAARTAHTREALHRTRIRAKRLRYAGEFLAPAFGSALADTVQQARDIQDGLGAALDAELAVDALLLDLERVAATPGRCGDAAAIARLARAHREEVAEGLARFATLWPALPKPSDLRERLEEEAR